MAELRDGRSEAGSPDSRRGRSRSAAVALEYAPHVGRPEDRRVADPREPEHRARVRRHAAPHDAPAEASIGDEERVVSGRSTRTPAVEDEVGRVGAADEPADRGLDGARVVLDVDDVDDRRAQALDLGPDARLEPLTRRRPRRDSLTTTPTRRARNGATHTIGCAAERRDPRRPRRSPASTTCGATLTLATRSPASDDLAVEHREHLERVEPVEPLQVGDVAR